MRVIAPFGGMEAMLDRVIAELTYARPCQLSFSPALIANLEGEWNAHNRKV
jgi:hypothetical protein